MRTILVLLAMAIPTSGWAAEYTTLADVPPELRQKNYHREYDRAGRPIGSCVHASVINMLRWHGHWEMAEWWRKAYCSGDYMDRLVRRLNHAGLKFAHTSNGDEEFLEWASRNRLLIGLPYYPAHFINMVDFTDTHAVLLDNRWPHVYIKVDRAEFLHKWKHEYGGFAVVLVYTPPPPWPKQ